MTLEVLIISFLLQETCYLNLWSLYDEAVYNNSKNINPVT